jgi:hypothetical protein
LNIKIESPDKMGDIELSAIVREPVRRVITIENPLS